MSKLVKFARTGAYITLIVELGGLPVAALAQQEAVEEYNHYLSNTGVVVRDDNRDLREAIDHLDSRIRCLEAPRNTCVSQSIESDTPARNTKSIPKREF